MLARERAVVDGGRRRRRSLWGVVSGVSVRRRSRGGGVQGAVKLVGHWNMSDVVEEMGSDSCC